MKNNEIKELTNSELLERLDSERAQLTQMKLNHAITPIENSSLIKESRRTIARILTEIRHRELN
ncbi:MAG: 50S ribosomal protein L29 [Paludibacteraceae bacterium]|nr:50S ribosomal protein L29 [Paludibacteraceae bacterium]